jgi:hypothetical protein
VIGGLLKSSYRAEEVAPKASIANARIREFTESRTIEECSTEPLAPSLLRFVNHFGQAVSFDVHGRMTSLELKRVLDKKLRALVGAETACSLIAHGLIIEFAAAVIRERTPRAPRVKEITQQSAVGSVPRLKSAVDD